MSKSLMGGLLVQGPRLAVRFCPTRAGVGPVEGGGGEVSGGGGGACGGGGGWGGGGGVGGWGGTPEREEGVGADWAEALASALWAHTTIRKVAPASPRTTV